jgi:hypothetical protein
MFFQGLSTFTKALSLNSCSPAYIRTKGLLNTVRSQNTNLFSTTFSEKGLQENFLIAGLSIHMAQKSVNLKHSLLLTEMFRFKPASQFTEW